MGGRSREGEESVNPTRQEEDHHRSFEPNLKQVLLNSGQEDGHWPGPYPGLPENNCELVRQNQQGYILPSFIQ